MSPPNGYVKCHPGDIHVEPERIAASSGDFVLREGALAHASRGRPSHRRLPQRRCRAKYDLRKGESDSDWEGHI